MKSRPNDKSAAIEKAVIAEIQALRALPRDGVDPTLLVTPARLLHHLILTSHGHVQLRFSTIASELGVEMRTLERAFTDEYQMTMTKFQATVRLAFSQWLLSVFPPTKISAIAAILGYHLVQDFNRFFKKHMHQSPTEWGRRERAKIMHAERGMPHN